MRNMRFWWFGCLLLALTACQSSRKDTGAPAFMDADQDGVALEDDCDDEDASLGATAEDADCGSGWGGH